MRLVAGLYALCGGHISSGFRNTATDALRSLPHRDDTPIYERTRTQLLAWLGDETPVAVSHFTDQRLSQ
jgi:hypothetical protein